MAATVLLGVVSYTSTRPDPPSSAPSRDRVISEIPAQPQAGVYPELVKLARRGVGDPLAVGRADAPVVMVEYADFKCGYCGKFARDSEPALIKKYVEDGTLRIEWRNFPIFGNQSEAAPAPPGRPDGRAASGSSTPPRTPRDRRRRASPSTGSTSSPARRG